MTDLFYDILQLSLLVLSFLFLIVLSKSFFGQFKSLNLLILTFTCFITFMFVNDIARNTNYAVTICYPFLVPFLFMTGPAAYLHYKSIKSSITDQDFLHYIPVAFFLLDLLSYALVYPQTYNQNIIHMTHRNFYAISNSFFFSPTFLLYALPIYSMGYFIFSLASILLRKERYKLALRPLLFILIIYSLSIIQIVASSSDNKLKTPFEEELRLPIMTLSALVLLIHLILFYKGKLISKEPLLAFLKPADQTPKISYEKLAGMKAYVADEYINANSIFFTPGVTKDTFILQTEFNTMEWTYYFTSNKIKYSELKQQIRIYRAQDLIRNGFLEKYSIEALSEEVGYRSRTSFYNAFEQVTGKKLAEYRKTNE